MRFVVKATGLTGNVNWLSAPDPEGVRSLVPREMADVFQTEAEAHVAIAKMPHAFKGIIFSVEKD